MVRLVKRPIVIYEQFGKKSRVPLNVYLNGKRIDSEEWDITWWIERGEDWYALMSVDFKDKRVLVVEREMFLLGLIHE